MQTKIYGFPYMLLVFNSTASGMVGGAAGAVAVARFVLPAPEPEPAITVMLPTPSLPGWELVGERRIENEGVLATPNQAAPRVWRILLDDGTVCYHDGFNSMSCDYLNRQEIP